MYGDEETPENELEQRIHEALFPGIPFKWQDYAQAQGVDPDKAPQNQSPAWRKWRNRKCDVLTMWCHIFYSGDAFVTNDDDDFHRKKAALISLDAKSILHPAEAVALVATLE